MMKSLHVNAALMHRAIPRWVVNLLSVLMRGGTAASIAVLLLCALPSDATAQNRIQNPGFDNNPPPPAIDGCLKDLKVAVKCNPGGTYTVTLSGAGFSGS
ncbi:MAG: hypothetical protein Q8K85_08210, partial [Hyphomicrobium sp.]|nr:hypothetical protein [Hyphomicrobium sp.]